MNNKGFTLIELLVVISIIVVLASIVLVGVQNATSKAADARIISAIAQMRTQAEIYRSDNGNYAGLTITSSDDIARINADVRNQTGGTDMTIVASNNDYCVMAPLQSSSTMVYCADAKGNAGNYDSTLVACDNTAGSEVAYCEDN